jgi:hypothetical protein
MNMAYSTLSNMFLWGQQGKKTDFLQHNGEFSNENILLCPSKDTGCFTIFIANILKLGQNVRYTIEQRIIFGITIERSRLFFSGQHKMS